MKMQNLKEKNEIQSPILEISHLHTVSGKSSVLEGNMKFSGHKEWAKKEYKLASFNWDHQKPLHYLNLHLYTGVVEMF